MEEETRIYLKNILVFTVVTLALIAVFSFGIFRLTQKKPDNFDTSSIQSLADSEISSSSTKSGKTLYIYKRIGYDEIFATTELGYQPEDFTQIGEYVSDKRSMFCRGLGDEILIYDLSYSLYNYKNKTIRKLDLGYNEIYSEVLFVYYKKTIFGLSVRKNDKVSFFSLEQNKFVTDFIYTNLDTYSPSPLKGYVIGRKWLPDTEENESEVFEIKTGKVVYTTKEGLTSFGNETALFFGILAEDMPFAGDAKIYNSGFKPLLNGEIVIEYKATKEGNLLVLYDNGSTFSIYNTDGQKLYTSKSYKIVHLIGDDYIGVVDSENNLCLLDTNEKVLATFAKWNDDMEFHHMISGLYDGSAEGKKYGAYILVEDKSVKEGTEGRGKEYFYDVKTGETEVFLLPEIGGYAKPVLYLYPTEKTAVTVSFKKPELLTTTYPKFKSSWSVTAFPDGSLYDQKGKFYYALYWEEKGSSFVDFSTGFYVTKDTAIPFLEEKLTALGLNEREQNEFIMYWLPILEKNEKNLVYFETTTQRERYNKLNISPQPDCLLRVAIHVKRVDSPVLIKEQKLPAFERKGFVAVEWGGVVH